MTGILLDDSNEIMIEHGSMKIGNTTAQQCRMIIEMNKGELKEYPTLGFGILKWLRSVETPTTKQKFVNELEKELKLNGIEAKVIVGKTISDFQLKIKN